MHFHEAGLQRAKQLRLSFCEMRPQAPASNPPTSNPAYSRLLETLEQRVNQSVDEVNRRHDAEPLLTRFPPHPDKK